MRGYSIRWFLLILVLIALAPGLVSTSFEIRHSFRQQTEAALEITQTAANATARRVDNFLANAKKIAVSAAARPEIGLTDPRLWSITFLRDGDCADLYCPSGPARTGRDDRSRPVLKASASVAGDRSTGRIRP